MKIILASGSPRRRELMSEIFEKYEVITADVDERSLESEIEKKMSCQDMTVVASEMVKELSKAKAAAVFNKLGRPSDVLVIGADTAVAVSDEIMGKPSDRDDAVRMLRKLSLEKQHVLTGVTFVLNDRYSSFCETSLVFFNYLDDAQEEKIQRYCDTDEPYDKAGAYGIQVIGDDMVDHIEGDIKNIMGFPVDRIKKELESFLG